MKEPKQNSFYLKHERIINWCSALIIFTVVFVVCMQFVFLKLNEQEFIRCEEVAYNIYNQMQENALLYEVPEDVRVSVSDTKITVVLNQFKFGKVIASIKNNELVITRDFAEAFCVFESTLVGIIASLIWGSILANYKRKQIKAMRNKQV